MSDRRCPSSVICYLPPVLKDVALGILAGGRGMRFGGTDKGLLVAKGRPLIRLILDRLAPGFGEILVSTNQPEPYQLLRMRTVADILPDRCPLSGLHALLKGMRSSRLFLVGCDMPAASLRLAERLAREDADVILPVSPSGDEPLHAIYSKSCVPAIEKAAAAGRLKMTDFLGDVHVVRVPVDPAEWADGPLSPFLNVNTPEDLGRI